MTTTADAASLDLRGRSITTFIAYEVTQRLAHLDGGEVLEVITDARDDVDRDVRAWCRATGQELTGADLRDSDHRYLIRKRPRRRTDRRLAAVISDPGLEQLLSPLGFALAAALEGIEVSLYFQGPAVRVLTRGFAERLHGPARPFSRFARAGLARAGPLPAQEKIRQLQTLGAHIYACGPSMEHYRVRRADLAIDGVTVAEYLTFMEAMASADIHLFVQ
jgi:predicted peroxiredoxin/TusA-related sulfurtransferase